MKIPIGMEQGHMTYSALFQLFVFSENFIAQIWGTCQSLFFSLPWKEGTFPGLLFEEGDETILIAITKSG